MLEKITPEQIEECGVASAPDRLTGNPADVKAVFDRLVKELVARVVNDIIDAHNGLDEAVNKRIDDALEELKKLSEINADDLGANNIALDKPGEATLALAYGLTSLVPTVYEALSVLSEWAKLKPETARLCGVEETATLSDAIAAQSAAVGTLLGEKAQVFVGSYTGVGVPYYNAEDDEHGIGLNFPFTPKYIEVFRVVKATGATAIYEDYYLEKTLVLINPATVGTTHTNKNGGGSGSYDAGLHVRVDWGDRYVYWRTAEIYPDSGGDDPNYDTWATVQADTSGELYYYVAIG